MTTWGIIPAAGEGTRIQPLAFSKELLPVGSRSDRGVERPRAVSEYLLERMVRAGAERLCLVISPGKADIISYYGGTYDGASLCYVVQDRPAGLCDAVFRALGVVRDADRILVGLPDTVWFPEEGFSALPDEGLSFLLFPVRRPELFDAVLTEPDGRVREVRVKSSDPGTGWVWGGFKLSGAILRELHQLWVERDRKDPYLGTLVNAWLAKGGAACGVRAGHAYVDVGTLNGFREALRLLGDRREGGQP